MRRTGPLPETNDFQRHRAVQTFLTRPINDSLSAATDFLDQIVIAKSHLHARLFRRVPVFIVERSETSAEKTDAAQSARRIGKDGRPALCANSFGSRHSPCGWLRHFSCTARNSSRDRKSVV